MCSWRNIFVRDSMSKRKKMPWLSNELLGSMNKLKQGLWWVTSVVLYSLTQATLMSPGKDETRVCGYIRSEFIHWALWRTLMRTKYFLFVHHTTSILPKLSTWCFEHSGDINCSLLVNPSHTDESREGRNTCLWIYIYIYIFVIVARY